jgi:hypothetical protein
MNPQMLGEKDAAGRRDSLLGAEHRAQVFNRDIIGWDEVACLRANSVRLPMFE